MKLEIKKWFDGKVIFSHECEKNTIKLTVTAALKAKVSLRGADLRGADLSDAVLRGADLSDAVLRGAVLRGADLSDAVLRGAVLRGADLRGAGLRGAGLSDADLRDADLRGADLRGAGLSGAGLSGADLRGAGLSEELMRSLKVEALDTKILAAISDGGKLDMGNWHSCNTTHCRAGWAITLCPSGKAVEALVGSSAAGALIYQSSYPKMKIPHFCCGNEGALADIKARAETDKVEAPAKK